MGYSYIAAGISIINDIVYEDGKAIDGILGGCGIFAVSGIAQFTDDVILVTSGGPDFFDYYGRYLEENGLSEEGVYITMPHTHHTLLAYEEDGGRWAERSIFGDDYFALQNGNNRTTFEKLAPFLSEETKGLYLDSNAFEGIFGEIRKIRERSPRIKIMWEPTTMSRTDPDQHDSVLKGIGLCDAFSMNLNEAKAFFGTQDYDSTVECLKRIAKPCFLRLGTDGSAWIEDGTVTRCLAYIFEEGVDPTGCGNTSTAVSLWRWREGYAPAGIVCAANAAAALCSLQRGPAAVRDIGEYPDRKEISRELLGAVHTDC